MLPSSLSNPAVSHLFQTESTVYPSAVGLLTLTHVPASQAGERPAHIRPRCPMPQQPLQAQPGHPRQAPKRVLTAADPAQPLGLQQCCIYQQMTYISNRKKAQASAGFGLQEARAASKHWGGRLSLPHCQKVVQDECWPNGQWDACLFSLCRGEAGSRSQQHG